MKRLEQMLNAKDGQAFILLDGAMGTLLFASGLENGASPEAWNSEHPERVRTIHEQYIAVGSEVILTNSFGGTRFRLQLHNLQNRVVELNRAAAAIAREAADAAPHPVLVAGSMGPSGELLAPMGAMRLEHAKAAFAEQAEGLAAGGADLLWIETMSDLNEVRAAVAGARSVSDLPIVATMSFDTHGRTMMGVTAEETARAFGELGLAAYGANCGANLPHTEAAIRAMHMVDPDAMLVAKANAGIPRWEGNDLVYDGTPEVMTGYAQRVLSYGARLIGGCCGSSPDHLRLMKAALESAPSKAATTDSPPLNTSPPGNGQEPRANGRLRRRRRRRPPRESGS